ncbi:MAG: autotransporter domain-containing protein [Pseudomonadota bacterium]|nr:autotransporter domain-containing protein [Pseudomonadota bacterium]
MAEQIRTAVALCLSLAVLPGSWAAEERPSIYVIGSPSTPGADTISGSGPLVRLSSRVSGITGPEVETRDWLTQLGESLDIPADQVSFISPTFDQPEPDTRGLGQRLLGNLMDSALGADEPSSELGFSETDLIILNPPQSQLIEQLGRLTGGAFNLGNSVNSGELEQRIRDLSEAGGNRFVIFNTAVSGEETESRNADNMALAEQLDELSREAGLKVYLVDLEGLGADIAANPERYGITPQSENLNLASRLPVIGSLFEDDLGSLPQTQQTIAEMVTGTIHAVDAGPSFPAIAAQSALLMTRAHGALLNSELANGSARPATGGEQVALTQPYQLASAGAPVPAPEPEQRHGRRSLFFYGSGIQGERDPNSATVGFEHDAWAAGIGTRFPVTDTASLGIALGYGQSEATLSDGLGRIELDEIAVNGFVTMTGEHAYAGARLGFAIEDFGVIERHTGLSVYPIAHGETDGMTFSAEGRAGYNFGLGPLRFGPVVDVAFARTEIDAYEERDGGPLNLQVQEAEASSLLAMAGIQLAADLNLGRTQLRPVVEVGYQREFLNQEDEASVTLPTAQVVVVETVFDDPDAFVVATALDWQLGRHIGLRLSYQTVLERDDWEERTGSVQLRWRF